jgi:impB/mucB/samB family
MSPMIRETRKVRSSSSSRSRPIRYQEPASGRRAYGLTVRSRVRSLVRVVGVANLDPQRALRGGLELRRAAEGEVLEREAQRLRVRELPVQQVQGDLERGELLVVEVELREEVLLGTERVELLARELVPLRVERHAEGDELAAVGVEPPGEGLVGHLRVALDDRLDLAGGQRPALRHEEGDERELSDELVCVVRHGSYSFSVVTIVAHLDLDAFFAAVEELERPELASQPLVVGGDPRGRGVVATANYVARTYGIRSAMSCA